MSSKRISSIWSWHNTACVRVNGGSTLVTSNLPFDEWTAVFGSQRLTGALLDRLTHHVHVLTCNGDSYRMADAKHRRAKAATKTPETT